MVDFPTFGSPTIPQLSAICVSCCATKCSVVGCPCRGSPTKCSVVGWPCRESPTECSVVGWPCRGSPTECSAVG